MGLARNPSSPALGAAQGGGTALRGCKRGSPGPGGGLGGRFLAAELKES